MVLSKDQEVEETIVICSHQPARIQQQIEALTEIGRYRLPPGTAHTFTDWYWDLPGYPLAARRIAIRLRGESSGTLIALKGPDELNEDGVIRRREVERPWSDRGVEEVLRELAAAGLPGHWRRDIARDAEPSNAMRQLGFIPVQQRATVRLSRGVVVAERDDAAPVAELAVDKTIFDVDGASFVHREIEVEQKAPGGSTAAAAVSGLLLKRFAPDLRVWRHSKLATGKAIEGLVRERRLAVETDGQRALTPAAYDTIARFLESEGAGLVSSRNAGRL